MLRIILVIVVVLYHWIGIPDRDPSVRNPPQKGDQSDPPKTLKNPYSSDKENENHVFFTQKNAGFNPNVHFFLTTSIYMADVQRKIPNFAGYLGCNAGFCHSTPIAIKPTKQPNPLASNRLQQNLIAASAKLFMAFHYIGWLIGHPYKWLIIYYLNSGHGITNPNKALLFGGEIPENYHTFPLFDSRQMGPI